ncbi:response regulator [Caenimonas aquaedulcis]|uniref:Response regulator transcription factor n=1 Tax=Caenimonas aquaedulcis TaxID=2793270 RepID=A0A931MJ98_9BURK|nr:response regulator transcription factor [Caenimonas aquaedulcis]MBG9390558.1 response regulator transcription factor [Caenimonas aquaedulcis]
MTPQISSNRPIRVGIVDDHAITRYALTRQIRAQEHLVLAGEAGNGNEALEMVRRGGMDVMLLDLMMPGAGALDVLHRIKARAPDLGIIVFTNYPPDRYAVNALRLGANAYLGKQCEPGEIIKAIGMTAKGERYLTPDVGELLARAVGGPAGEPHEQLTQREFQLLLHFAKGESSAEIAQSLSLSPKTVSTYRSVLLKKMAAKSNSELTHYAVAKGLLD